jgi:hypothetical protein
VSSLSRDSPLLRLKAEKPMGAGMPGKAGVPGQSWTGHYHQGWGRVALVTARPQEVLWIQ